MASQIQFAALLPLVSLSFPTSYWLPDCPFLCPTGCWDLLPSCSPGLHARVYPKASGLSQ